MANIFNILSMHRSEELAAQLRDEQYARDREAQRRLDEGMETCQQLRDILGQTDYDAWWEAAPEAGFFAAAKTKLIEVLKAEMDAVMAEPTSGPLEQSKAIDAWMTAAWDTIPEVPFGD